MPLHKELALSKLKVIVRDPPIGTPGPEDIVIDHAANIGFIASQQHMSAASKLLQAGDMPGGRSSRSTSPPRRQRNARSPTFCLDAELTKS